jgi:hypothetical protein
MIGKQDAIYILMALFVVVLLLWLFSTLFPQ